MIKFLKLFFHKNEDKHYIEIKGKNFALLKQGNTKLILSLPKDIPTVERFCKWHKGYKFIQVDEVVNRKPK
jgi:hypothetical protein